MIWKRLNSEASSTLDMSEKLGLLKGRVSPINHGGRNALKTYVIPDKRRIHLKEKREYKKYSSQHMLEESTLYTNQDAEVDRVLTQNAFYKKR